MMRYEIKWHVGLLDDDEKVVNRVPKQKLTGRVFFSSSTTVSALQ